MSATPAGPGHDRELADRLRRSVERGVITETQAELILADRPPAGEPEVDRPATAGTPTVRGPIVAEALGYVGGVLVLIGAVTISMNFWEQIGLGGRLAVLFGAAAVLLITGAAVPAGRVQVAYRLRSVCWLGSVILFGAGVSVLAEEVLRAGSYSAVLTTGAGTVLAAGLWWLHRTVPQQAMVLIALAWTAGSAAYLLPNGWEHVNGLAVWGTGVAWLLLAEGGVIAARRAGAVLGGGAAIVGGLFTIGADWGAVLAIGTAVVLVAAGVGLRDLVLLALGAVATLLSVPMVIAQYVPDLLVVSLALLGCGVLLVAGGIVTARRRRLRPAEPDRVAIARVPAIAAAATVAVTVTIAVLLLGR